MNVDTKEHIIDTEYKESNNIPYIPSSYNKIESFDVISPPLNNTNKIQYSSISSNKKEKKNFRKKNNISIKTLFNAIFLLGI
jgi:hypothetical protein